MTRTPSFLLILVHVETFLFQIISLFFTLGMNNYFYILMDFTGRILSLFFYSIFLCQRLNFLLTASLSNPFKKVIGGVNWWNLCFPCFAFHGLKNVHLASSKISRLCPLPSGRQNWWQYWGEIWFHSHSCSFLGKLLFFFSLEDTKVVFSLSELLPECGLFAGCSHSPRLAFDGSFQSEGLYISFAWENFLL